MALVAADMADEIRAALAGAAGVAVNEVDEDWADALASAIVDYIVSNAEVTVASGIPVSTTGTASAQTGSTTSTGTGTIS